MAKRKAQSMDEVIEGGSIQVRKPIFPLEYLQVQDHGEVPPNKFIIWITGLHESGKSTAAAGVDPVRPGQEPNTFYIDLEGSTSTLRSQYALEVYDTLALDADQNYPRLEDDARNGMPFDERLFMAYKDLIERIRAGKEPRAIGKRTLVVDTLDKLMTGSNLWVRKNPALFGKHSFAGKEGTIFSFGPTHDWWNDHFIELTNWFDAIVVVSHVGDKWENNQKSGLKIKGAQLGRAASMTIWMHSPEGATEPGIPPNMRWAELKKNRYGWVYWPTIEDLKADGTLDRLVAEGVLGADEIDTIDENDDRLWEMLQEQPHTILPRKFPVPPGKTVFNIIRSYMRNPQRSYGELDVVVNPGDESALTADEKLQLEVAKAQAEAEAEVARTERLLSTEKARLKDRLMAIGYSFSEIQKAMTENNLSIASLSDIEAVYETLANLKAAGD